jgi:hypothetical protein
MEEKMFSLTVSNDNIQDTLELLKYMFPEKISLPGISFYVYQKTDEISLRKTRLCITSLRKKGYLIIANNGYVLAGDDPEPVIHFINGMYSRAHSLTTDADIMYHGLKQKYGDAVSEKVQQMPGQPMLQIEPLSPVVMAIINKQVPTFQTRLDCNTIPFRKSIDARGNEIALQFEEDA